MKRDEKSLHSFFLEPNKSHFIIAWTFEIVLHFWTFKWSVVSFTMNTFCLPYEFHFRIGWIWKCKRKIAKSIREWRQPPFRWRNSEIIIIVQRGYIECAKIMNTMETATTRNNFALPRNHYGLHWYRLRLWSWCFVCCINCFVHEMHLLKVHILKGHKLWLNIFHS